MEIIKKSSPNFNSGRQWKKVKRLVIHWVGTGTFDGAINWLCNPASKASAHYVVGDDVIYQLVEEKDTAWHTGVWDVNLETIGIEHDAIPDRPATELTYKTSAELIAGICERYNIPLDREHIIGHKEVKPTQCPGTMNIEKLIELAKGNTMDNSEDKIKELEEEIEGLRLSRDKWKREKKECEESKVKMEAEKNQHIESLQKSLSEMNAQLTNANKQIESITNDKNALEAKMGALNGELSECNTNYEKYQELLQTSNEKVLKLTNELTELQAKYKKKIKDISFFEFVRIKLKG